MIMVDVAVPAIGRQYNFSLEENVAVETVIAEIAEVICQKENCDLLGDVRKLRLCSVEHSAIFALSATLKQYGIRDGNQLMLV